MRQQCAGTGRKKSAGTEREDVMQFSRENLLSRRRFCFCCVGDAAYVSSAGWLAPREAFAEARGIVSLI
jgi:hypothetical protein